MQIYFLPFSCEAKEEEGINVIVGGHLRSGYIFV
jgi:hypothetical protein